MVVQKLVFEVVFRVDIRPCLLNEVDRFLKISCMDRDTGVKVERRVVHQCVRKYRFGKGRSAKVLYDVDAWRRDLVLAYGYVLVRDFSGTGISQVACSGLIHGEYVAV